MMATLWQDIRYGFRMLARNPGFTVAVVLVLALGIGVNTAIFNSLDQVLLRALPVEKPHELVMLEYRDVDENDGSSLAGATFNYPLYESYRDQSRVFTDLAAFDDTTMTLRVGDVTSQVQGMAVSSNYFSVLGVRPALGNFFFPEEDRSGSPEFLVVISYGLWHRQFGADPAVTGKQVAINGHPVTIVGVTPRGFTGTMVGSVTEVYVPARAWAAIERRPLENRSFANWYLLGRLKPGVSRPRAQAALRVLAAQIKQVEPNNTFVNVSVSDASRGPVNWRKQKASVPLLLLMLTTALVLLTACANVANLQLARAITQQREIAIRQALGASRARIAQHLLMENVVLALVAGLAGAVLAVWLDSWLCAIVARVGSANVTPGLNGRMLLFALAVSLTVGVACGLAPALQTTRPDITPALQNSPGSTSRSGRRGNMHSLLVVVQIAFSIVVLVCGGMCLYSLVKIQRVDPGFDPARILAVSVNVQGQNRGPSDAAGFWETLRERVAALPGVESTSLADAIPLVPSGGYMSGVKRIEGRAMAAEERISWSRAFVSPGYFRTLGVPLLEGRDLSAEDLAGPSRVMIINEMAARQGWRGQDPLGKRVAFYASGTPDGEEVREVVGVVKAAKHRSIHEEFRPMVYVPRANAQDDTPVLLVRVTRAPQALVPGIRQVARSLGASASACDIRTIAQRQWVLFHSQRVLAGILGGCGLAVLVLSGMGIYSVMAYAVRRRTREIGIRMALGAQRRDVLVLVLGKGALLAIIGSGFGIAVSLIAMRLLESSVPGMRQMWDASFLYGFSPWDPWPYVGAAAVLGLIALMACYGPARRASRIDPIAALKYE